jgi:hypothetical protein
MNNHRTILIGNWPLLGHLILLASVKAVILTRSIGEGCHTGNLCDTFLPQAPPISTSNAVLCVITKTAQLVWCSARPRYHIELRRLKITSSRGVGRGLCMSLWGSLHVCPCNFCLPRLLPASDWPSFIQVSMHMCECAHTNTHWKLQMVAHALTQSSCFFLHCINSSWWIIRIVHGGR